MSRVPIPGFNDPFSLVDRQPHLFRVQLAAFGEVGQDRLASSQKLRACRDQPRVFGLAWVRAELADPLVDRGPRSNVR